MVEHLEEAFHGDVAFAAAVDIVAKLHVVGGHAFGDGCAGGACFEKVAGDFLSSADFGKRSIDLGIEVEG